MDGPSALWSNYIKYIGAGAVATGGIISLIKSLPLIVRTFKQAIGSMKKNAGSSNQLRTEQDLPFPLLIGVIIVIAVLIWILPIFPVNLIGALIIVVFGFFFANVSFLWEEAEVNGWKKYVKISILQQNPTV